MTIGIMQVMDQLRFALGLLAAEWIFMRGRAPRRAHFAVKSLFLLLSVAAFAVLQLLLRAALLAMSFPMPVVLVSMWVLGYTTNLLAMWGIKCCCDISWTNLLSRCLLGSCLERAVMVFWRSFVSGIWFPDFETQHPVGYLVLMLAWYFVCYTLAARLLAPHFSRDVVPGNQESIRLCALYILSVTILAIVSSYASAVAEFRESEFWAERGMPVLYLAAWMELLIALVMFVFQYAIYSVATLRQETLLLNRLLDEKASQYKTSAENIDIINQKCHDLKHQLAALEHSDAAHRVRLLREVQQAVMIYDAAIHTGCAVLDTLLTEKSLYCAKQQIRLSCMADAAGLDAIDVVDLYTMLGNALDNAIEYVCRFQDTEKRVISLSVRHRENQVVITVDNYFEGTLQYQDGLPVTSKGDSFSHGLGLKSIRMLAQKYCGDIHIIAEANTFTLQIFMLL